MNLLKQAGFGTEEIKDYEHILVKHCPQILKVILKILLI